MPRLRLANPLPRLTMFCLGALLGLFVFYLLFVASASQRYDHLLRQHGQSLAESTAQQAVDPSLHNDLVSLRAICDLTASRPGVSAVAVHDVENQMLVQAGQMPGEGDARHAVFTSPITLNDSLAGYITVAITRQSLISSSAYILLNALWIVLAALCAWSLYRAKTFALEWPQKSEAPAAPEIEEREVLVEHFAYAALCVKNVAVLRQQLDGGTFRSLFASVETLIEGIMMLYGGKDWRWQDNRYVIRFKSLTDEHSALFQAACAAYLLLDLAAITDNIPLDLSAQIAIDDKELASSHMPFVGLAVEGNIAQIPDLAERVVYLELGPGDDRKIIAEFRAPYAALLEKQSTQLRAMEAQ